MYVHWYTVQVAGETLTQSACVAYCCRLWSGSDCFCCRKPPASYPVCVDLQAAVQRCYQENPTTTLNCAPQVRAFRECVEKQRETLLARKGWSALT